MSSMLTSPATTSALTQTISASVSSADTGLGRSLHAKAAPPQPESAVDTLAPHTIPVDPHRGGTLLFADGEASLSKAQALPADAEHVALDVHGLDRPHLRANGQGLEILGGVGRCSAKRQAIVTPDGAVQLAQDSDPVVPKSGPPEGFEVFDVRAQAKSGTPAPSASVTGSGIIDARATVLYTLRQVNSEASSRGNQVTFEVTPSVTVENRSRADLQGVDVVFGARPKAPDAEPSPALKETAELLRLMGRGDPEALAKPQTKNPLPQVRGGYVTFDLETSMGIPAGAKRIAAFGPVDKSSLTFQQSLSIPLQLDIPAEGDDARYYDVAFPESQFKLQRAPARLAPADYELDFGTTSVTVLKQPFVEKNGTLTLQAGTLDTISVAAETSVVKQGSEHYDVTTTVTFSNSDASARKVDLALDTVKFHSLSDINVTVNGKKVPYTFNDTGARLKVTVSLPDADGSATAREPTVLITFSAVRPKSKEEERALKPAPFGIYL